MGKNFQPKGKQSRRDGVAVHPKGVKALARRPFTPGQHGPESRNKLSEYGKQLREKQKAKHVFGILEKQFSNYFKKASKAKGNTGILLVQMLETRLDNAVYRMGLAKTRPQARQMVSHGMIFVNGRKLNIPSYAVEIGDVISVKPKSQSSALFAEIGKEKNQSALGWLSQSSDFEAKVIGVPAETEVEQSFDPRLIVEFYSR